MLTSSGDGLAPGMTVINREALSVIEDRSRHQLSRRGNWADDNRGVILVFVIVFIVCSGIFGLLGYRQWMARRARRARYEIEEIK